MENPMIPPGSEPVVWKRPEPKQKEEIPSSSFVMGGRRLSKESGQMPIAPKNTIQAAPQQWVHKATPRTNNQGGLGTRRLHQIGQATLIPDKAVAPKNAKPAVTKDQLNTLIQEQVKNRKPVEGTTTSRIATKAQEIKAGKVAKKITFAGSLSSKGPTAELKTLGGSVNPVAHIKEDFMVPASRLPSEVPEVRVTHANQIDKTFKHTFTKAFAKGLAPAGKTWINRTYADEVKPFLSELATPEDLRHQIEVAKLQITRIKRTGRSAAQAQINLDKLNESLNNMESLHTQFQNKVDGLIDTIRNEIKTLSIQIERNQQRGKGASDLIDQKAAAEVLLVELQEVAASTRPSALEGVTPLYSKEAILSHLDILSHQEEGISAELRSAIVNIPGDFVQLGNLQKIGVPNLDLLSRNTEAHYSVMEAMEKSGNNEAFQKQIMEGADLTYTPGYAFKAQQGIVGSENRIEMRAQEHNRIAPLTDFLVPKTEQELKSVAITTGKAERFVAPKGIVSEFLIKGTDISKTQWVALSNKRAAIAAKEFKGEPVSQAERAELDALTQAAANEVGSRSVIQHALMDLELWSGDNHPEQYKVVDGEAHCFDFARMLPPGEAVQHEVAPGKVETMCLLKSTFLDHPHSQEEIPPDMVKAFLARDLKAEDAKLKENGMIGTPEFFDAATQRMTGHARDIHSLATASEQDLRALATKYGVKAPLRIGGRYRDLFVPTLRAAIENERAELKETCFNLDHPKGHAMRQERAAKMQEYLRTAEKPTAQGMRDYVLADTLAPFFKVYARLNGAPTLNIGINHDLIGHSARPITLEQIIQNAASAGVATRGELAEMHAALAKIKENSCSWAEVHTTAIAG